MTDQFIHIPVEDIFPNPEQPRKRFDPEKLAELAQSIKEHGLIQPVEVEAWEDVYILRDGERRLRASKLAKIKTIPAIVKPSLNGSGPKVRLMRAMVANIQRDDMNPIEEGHGYRELVDVHGYSVPKLSEKIGKNQAHIYNRILLTKYDPEIQELISAGRFPHDVRLAREIMQIDDKEARVKLAQSLAERKLTIKGCIEAARKLRKALQSRALMVQTPSIHLAARSTNMDFDEDQPPSGWTMLDSLDRLPPWEIVSKMAVRTCQECELRSMANEEVCSPCPGVMMLKNMVAEVVRVS